MDINNEHFQINMNGEHKNGSAYFYAIEQGSVEKRLSESGLDDPYARLLITLTGDQSLNQSITDFDQKKQAEKNQADPSLNDVDSVDVSKTEPSDSSATEEVPQAPSIFNLEQWLEQVNANAQDQGKTLDEVRVDSMILAYSKLPLITFFATHDQEGFTPEDRTKAFECLKSFGVNPLTLDDSGQGLLHYLVRANRLAILRQCISIWPEVESQVNVPWNHGIPPLMLAVLGSHFEMIQELLELGAHMTPLCHEESLFSLNIANRTIAKRNEAQLKADEQLKIKIAKLLVRHGALDPSKVGLVNCQKIKDSALFDLINEDFKSGEAFEFLRLLVSWGANINAKNGDGNSILMLASQGKTMTVINEILKWGAQIDAKNKKGETATLIAAKHKNFTVMKELINQGASFDVIDQEKNGVLHYAISGGSMEIISWLLTLIDPVRFSSQLRDGEKPITPWMIACKRGYASCLSTILETRQSVSEEKIDVYHQDERGYNGLMLATVNQCKNIVDWYFESAMDSAPDLKTCITAEGQDLLMAACKYAKESSVPLIRQMMPYKSSAQQVDVEGRTALHGAMGTNSPELILDLIADGFDVSVEDKKGNTPLDLAILGQHEELIPLLMSKRAPFNPKVVEQLPEGCKTKVMMKERMLAMTEKDELEQMVDHIRVEVSSWKETICEWIGVQSEPSPESSSKRAWAGHRL